MRKIVLAAAAAAMLAAGCGSSGTTHARPAASATAAAHASADCAKLTASAFPPATYDKLVIREVSRLAAGGNASAGQERKARAAIAREVRLACPQFAYLAKQER